MCLAFCSSSISPPVLLSFFFNDSPPTDIYTLSLHDALPISALARRDGLVRVEREARHRRRVLAAATQHAARVLHGRGERVGGDRKSTRLNSSHPSISYAVFCLKKKKNAKPHHMIDNPPTRH